MTTYQYFIIKNVQAKHQFNSIVINNYNILTQNKVRGQKMHLHRREKFLSESACQLSK